MNQKAIVFSWLLFLAPLAVFAAEQTPIAAESSAVQNKQPAGEMKHQVQPLQSRTDQKKNLAESKQVQEYPVQVEPFLPRMKPMGKLISLKYANGLRNGANSDTHRCKQLTEHGEERCIKLREIAGFSAVRTIFQIVGPRKILHCLLGK